MFARDLAMTLEGAIDRDFIPTRERIGGELCLADHPRPVFLSQWDIKSTAQMTERHIR